MSSLLIHNAKIYVEKGHFAQALLITDSIIKAVGSLEEVEAQTPADVARYDALGRTIVPGFNDSHQHLLNTGVALSDIRLNNAKSIADVKRIAREWIAEHRPAPGTVLHGMGWNQDYFEDEQRLLTRDDLDEITTEHPLVLERACAHLLTANTAALELAGVTETTPVPEGGTLGRDENGRLNGIFAENARSLVLALYRVRPLEDCVTLIRTAMRHAAECGVTSVGTCDLRAGTWHTVLEAYNRVMNDTANPPTLRVWHQSSFQANPAEYREFLESGHAMGSGTPMHRFGPLKLFVDGSLGARTALMRAPYHDAPETCGIATLTREEIDELVQMAVSHNCSVVTHAIGDGAVERILDAYDAVCPKTGGNPLRLGVVHVQITDKPLLERFTKNGILALVQPIFLHYDIQIVEDRVGKALASTSYAFGTLTRLGVHTSYGTDSPIEDMNPIDNLYCAVTRRRLNGEPVGGFNPTEAVSVEEAVDAYTIESAYASFEENVKGRLMPGYYADLVVLSDDIFTMNPLELRKTRVMATMVDGKFVYERPAA